VSDAPRPTEPAAGEGLLTFDRMPADVPPASTLIATMVDEVSELYGGRIEGEGLPTARPEELRPPNGACVVGHLDGTAVTVGVVKRFDEDAAEIKRMYVAPEGRSRGIARALLQALEAAARDLGYARVRLDTGAGQPHAKALYLSAGYTEIPDYNGNPFASFWAEKEL
jgi:GNAT superfamily N-acetyltransferase